MELVLSPSTPGLSVGELADLWRHPEELGYRQLLGGREFAVAGLTVAFRSTVEDTLRVLAP